MTWPHRPPTGPPGRRSAGPSTHPPGGPPGIRGRQRGRPPPPSGHPGRERREQDHAYVILHDCGAGYGDDPYLDGGYGDPGTDPYGDCYDALDCGGGDGGDYGCFGGGGGGCFYAAFDEGSDEYWLEHYDC